MENDNDLMNTLQKNMNLLSTELKEKKTELNNVCSNIFTHLYIG